MTSQYQNPWYPNILCFTIDGNSLESALRYENVETEKFRFVNVYFKGCCHDEYT